MSLLENVQWLCKIHGTSIAKLEKHLEFGNGAVYKWGECSPSIEKVQKVARYFKVSLDFITGDRTQEHSDVVIMTLAARCIGHSEMLTKSEIDRVKLAIRIALECSTSSDEKR